MKWLNNRIPPPVVALIFAALMWLISNVSYVFEPNLFLQGILIAGLVISGVYFDVSALLAFRAVNTTINPLSPEKTSSFVSSGIYRISRNPMYVGMSAFLAGWAVFLLSVPSLLGVVLFCLYINKFQILPEERILKELFGNEYESYCSQVRRWL